MNIPAKSALYHVLWAGALWVLHTGSVVFGQQASVDRNALNEASKFRLMEPLDSIVADLESYIPAFMEKERIPGSAMAMVYEGKVAWSEGFGKRSSWTNKSVSPETLFELASNSKMVTAYLALRLVDRGMLSLDEALDTYLTEPWLPSAEYRNVISLRHVLSHSSGLGHNGMNKDLLFPPGEAYSYSNLGYLYLQAVIEELSGLTLEEAAREMVFEPLGMSSSSFINQAPLKSRLANGHVGGTFLANFSVVIYLIALCLLGIIGMIIHRIVSGRWIPSKRTLKRALVFSFALWLLMLFILFRLVGFPKYAWLIFMFGLVFTTCFFLLYAAGRALITQFLPGRARTLRLLAVVWGLLVVIGLFLGTRKFDNIPVPKWPYVRSMAPASLRSSAEDMATFLAEIAHPRYLSTDLALQLRSPQIDLSDDLSWGLGPGIQYGPQGEAIWQWGQNADFQSAMIIYPEHGFGVVVMTNSASDNPDVAIKMAHRALGGKIETILQGSHLAFSGVKEGT
jgi:CubicO group peptidase (beta-lactamase class C family)